MSKEHITAMISAEEMRKKQEETIDKADINKREVADLTVYIYSQLRNIAEHFPTIKNLIINRDKLIKYSKVSILHVARILKDESGYEVDYSVSRDMNRTEERLIIKW